MGSSFLSTYLVVPLGELILGVGGGHQSLGQWLNNSNSNIDMPLQLPLVDC